MSCEGGNNFLALLGLQEVYNRFWKDHNIPLFGVLELTYQCNFRCLHCYADDQHAQPNLSKEELITLVDQMVQAGTLVLTLSGGDPLMHPYFAFIYKYIRKKGIFVEVFTNGSLITEDIINLFLEYPPINIDITLYGASNETYSEVTGLIDGYTATMRGIQLLKASGIHFTLKTCVIRENVLDLFKIKEIAKDLGVDYRYSFDIAPSIGGKTYVRQHMLSPQEIVEIELLDPERTKQWASQKLAEIDEVPYYELPVFNCKTGRFTFCISASGLLSGCIHDRSNLYDLSSGDFLSGWKAINRMVHEPKITPDYSCASCEYLPFCNTCPADSQREYGSPYMTNPIQCALAKLRYKSFVGKEDSEHEI